MVKANHAYELLELLGQGGFGTVYKARFQGVGGFTQLVALKMLHGSNEGRAEVLARLRDEARVLGLLHHRAIVRAFRLVQLQDRWAIVMEYVAGVDLRRLLNARGLLPSGPAFEIVSEVAGALHAAYRTVGPNGQPIHLLHRDIKPPNIQLTPYGETRLLDFGIVHATFTAREAETQSAIFGSIEYMAPERFDRVEGPEGDIYSLGATLYELLTGEVYGQGPSSVARLRRRLTYADEQLLARLPGETEGARALVLQMLDPDPSLRPSARDVERTALALRGRQNSPLLRDWAEQMVPAVLEELSEGPPDPLVGRVLEEMSEIALTPTLKPGDDTRWEALPLPRAAPPRPAEPRSEVASEAVLPQAGADTAVPLIGGADTAVPTTFTAQGASLAARETVARPPPPMVPPTARTSQTPVPLALPGPRSSAWDATPSLPVPDRAEPTGGRLGLYGGVLSLALLISVTAVVLGLAFYARPEPAPPPAPVDLSIPVPEPTPPVPEPTPPVPEPTPPVAAPELPPPITTPTSAPPAPHSPPHHPSAHPSPEAAVSPPEETGARSVRIVGLSGAVYLTRGAARYALPANVPPGAYTVEAETDGQGMSQVARATIPAGSGGLVLRCNIAVGSCDTAP